jgi:GNAT superfamily N-acetyltransferase
MAMPEEAAVLLDSHIRMQTGSYVSGVDSGPDGARYLWSERIPEPSLNLAVGTEDIGWTMEAAARRGRMPAILAADAAAVERLQATPGFAGAFPTRWMVRPLDRRDLPAPPGDLSVHEGPGLPADALAVSTRLYKDPAHNAIAAELYVPTLERARTGEAVQSFHLVLRDGGEPVACASVYVLDGLAGLYNVGTLADRQGEGFGAAVTAAAARQAAACDCDRMFLQCAAGTHVERLYGRLGFRTVASPAIACFAIG